MLMVTRGNSANYYPSFTGYFLGFEYYAKKSKPMNLQLYRCVVAAYTTTKYKGTNFLLSFSLLVLAPPLNAPWTHVGSV